MNSENMLHKTSQTERANVWPAALRSPGLRERAVRSYSLMGTWAQSGVIKKSLENGSNGYTTLQM